MEFVSFGHFLEYKRKEKKLTMREMAEKSNMVIPYYSDIEKNKRNPPALQILKVFAETLHLDEEEKNQMYDLAGRQRGEIAPDLTEYAMQPYVATALRKARDSGSKEKEWNEMVKDLLERTKTK